MDAAYVAIPRIELTRRRDDGEEADSVASGMMEVTRMEVGRTSARGPWDKGYERRTTKVRIAAIAVVGVEIGIRIVVVVDSINDVIIIIVRIDVGKKRSRRAGSGGSGGDVGGTENTSGR